MVVRTVLGDIAPDALGACDAHEHLFLDTPAQPGESFLDRDKAVEEARTLVAVGGRALVDWTPLGLGRDLDGLAHVARETGLNVVAATGLHRDAHYTAEELLRTTSTDALADLFVSELADRCGVIKAGASYHHLTAFEELAFEAAAAAHGRTGAPVCVHTQHGTMGLALVGYVVRDVCGETTARLSSASRSSSPAAHSTFSARHMDGQRTVRFALATARREGIERYPCQPMTLTAELATVTIEGSQADQLPNLASF